MTKSCRFCRASPSDSREMCRRGSSDTLNQPRSSLEQEPGKLKLLGKAVLRRPNRQRSGSPVAACADEVVDRQAQAVAGGDTAPSREGGLAVPVRAPRTLGTYPGAHCRGSRAAPSPHSCKSPRPSRSGSRHCDIRRFIKTPKHPSPETAPANCGQSHAMGYRFQKENCL